MVKKNLFLLIIIMALLVSTKCGDSRFSKLKKLEGGIYHVVFSKNMWVHYLGNIEYGGLKLMETSQKQVCFQDISGEFSKYNLGDELKERISNSRPPLKNVELQERSDGSFCVSASGIHAIFQNGKKIWENESKEDF